MILTCLFIAPTANTGRGIFTNENIRAGTTIEISPVIVMNEADRVLLDRTLLHDYIFEWGQNKNECCMALGYVPLYNHSYRSSCEYEMDYGKEIISIKTIRYVKEGEELTINYSGDWNSKKKVWFEVK